MLRIYLGGPIDGCTYDETHQWRDDFIKAHPDLECLDPTGRTYDDPLGDWKKLVELDLVDILNSHALLAHVWKTSAGTAMELVVAHNSGIPVVTVVPDLNRVGPWIRYYSDYVVDSFDEAYELLTT